MFPFPSLLDNLGPYGLLEHVSAPAPWPLYLNPPTARNLRYSGPDDLRAPSMLALLPPLCIRSQRVHSANGSCCLVSRRATFVGVAPPSTTLDPHSPAWSAYLRVTQTGHIGCRWSSSILAQSLPNARLLWVTCLAIWD